MSDVIYYLQAGDGPVRIDACTEHRLRMRIGQLQAGNPELLLLRALYEGDDATLAGLRHHHHAHRIYDAWYRPDVLAQAPIAGMYLNPVWFDRDAEQRRVAVRAMQALSLQGRA